MHNSEPKPALRAAAAEITSTLHTRLAVLNSALVADAEVEDQLRHQVEGILEQTFKRMGLDRTLTLRRTTGEGTTVGELRARQNIHPVDSLTAATHLFDIALDALTRRGLDADQTAKALNASIMANVIPASVAYVNVLLERLAVAHSEERLGISRELHDRVAHGIAAGIQRVELARNGMGAEASRISEALSLLEGALDETRAIALDLRHMVGEKDLDQALRDYVVDLDPNGPPVYVNSVGMPYALATGTQEEAFIVIREAIHNARRHSNAGRIMVDFDWTASGVSVKVVDNGSGFRHDAIRAGALGLVAAQERAELIGADLSIETEIERGTTVTLTIARNEGQL
ncbi:sensor histidine kinase [Leifsonia sp. EB34]|uniref:sensor histidine kinase n=1 Tax=Leifsonia sp. EB34 TaxID=3156303 RepID=UPI0035114337